MNNRNIAIIRIRGRTGVSRKVNDTLDMMRLYKQNGCVIIPNQPQYLGMIQRAKDYVTWGEIDKETFTLLFRKRARVAGNKPLTEEYLKQHIQLDTQTFIEEFFTFKKKLRDVPGLKPYFRLTPPNKGFERGGIKKPFSMGGSLGYRKDKIANDTRRFRIDAIRKLRLPRSISAAISKTIRGTVSATV